MKEQQICTCKNPEPRTKCSENGISSYCNNCCKEYKKNKS